MFYVLKPITAKRAAEVAFQLVEIFLLLGSHANLQIDNGSEFTASVITDLKQVWPKLALVHAKPRHPQNQGSLERGNGDIERGMLVAWLADNARLERNIGLLGSNLYSSKRIPRSILHPLFGHVWMRGTCWTNINVSAIRGDKHPNK